MKQVWNLVLDIQRPDQTFDSSLVLLRVSQVVHLVDECKELISQHTEIPQEMYLEPFLAAGMALSTLNLEETWEDFIHRLPPDSVKSMLYTSNYLSRDHAEEVIEEEILEELLADVAEIFEKVIDSELEDDLKTFLVDALDDIRTAILGYRIQGLAGLKSALDSTLGSAFRFRDEISKIREDSNSRDTVLDFFKLLTKVDGLVATFLKVKQLAAPFVQSILPGSTDS